MADGWSYDKLSKMVASDISTLIKRSKQIIQALSDRREENRNQLQDLITQIASRHSGALLHNTPKVGRRKAIQRIDTIAEDEVAEFDSAKTSIIVLKDEIKEEEAGSEVSRFNGRLKRSASVKAADCIKKQQSLTLSSKLRRPENDEDKRSSKATRNSRSKRSKASLSSSDEESEKRPSKHSKKTHETIKTINGDPARDSDSATKRKHQETKTRSPRHSSRNSSLRLEEPAAKKANVIDEAHNRSNQLDDTNEVTTYEDADTKLPLSNSTMNCSNSIMNVARVINDATMILDKNNSTILMDKTNKKIMDSTVVLETLPRNMNETVTLSKHSRKKSDTNLRSSNRPTRCSRNGLQERLETLTKIMANKDFDALITDDESSPELAKPVKKFTGEQSKPIKPQIIIQSISSPDCDDDDDETYVPKSKKSVKNVFRNDVGTGSKLKNTYKPNPLFSPYAKESVKKRVEAFEEAGLNSLKSVDADVPPRLTRTKTRAMAAAEAAVNHVPHVQTIAQKLARKSLAKAKRISLAKTMKKNGESKENSAPAGASVKSSRLIPRNDELTRKQQQRMTPVGQSRLQNPMSVNRIQVTPNNQFFNNHAKEMSASRPNIVTNVESFIPLPKTVHRDRSIEKAEERRRRMEEDARKKRDEALKLLTEGKRRKREEKELKIKLAREAKEKRDMAKRLKAEEEKKEKARIALLIQEKQREEAERKRLAQLQRAQEKEEKRKQEEQQRLQRLQEQEEAERKLAEQKRKEQEAAERHHHRRLAEVRAQQAAQAEALRMKAEYLTAQSKVEQYNSTVKPQNTLNYIIDSEPDEDLSDSEAKPKYPIPSWAKSGIRLTHLDMQEFVPLSTVHRFFASGKCTPDLTQLFRGIDKTQLKRTSSAIWKTPPRYSMMAAED